LLHSELDWLWVLYHSADLLPEQALLCSQHA